MKRLRFLAARKSDRRFNAPPAFDQCAVALRVIAYQHLAEGRVEGLDMAREILAIFEIELLPPPPPPPGAARKSLAIAAADQPIVRMPLDSSDQPDKPS